MAEQRSYTGGFDNRWLFTGKELDESTGLYYFGARFYNPSTSIWLSVDPLAEQAPNWTPYRYGFQNPISYTDPTGMFEESIDPEPKKKVSFPRLNYFFSIKFSFNRKRYVHLNLIKETKKERLNSDWIPDSSSSTIINLSKKFLIEKFFKSRHRNLTPDKKGGAQDAIVKLTNKATDFEIKRRIVNFTTYEGYEWYGDVWINLFTKDITKVDFERASDIKTFKFFSEETVIQEALFLKGSDEPLFINDLCKGKDCTKYNILGSYIDNKFDNEIDQNQLPTQNYDVRNEN